MARARLLKPGFFKNEELAKLSPYHRLLFEGLWTLADREGRLEDRPGWIRIEIFPYEPNVDVEPMLSDLHRTRFIQRYRAHGKQLIQVTKFPRHQNPHMREAKSELPPPKRSRKTQEKSSGQGSAEHSASTVLDTDQGSAEHDPGPAVPVTGDPVTGDPVTGDGDGNGEGSGDGGSTPLSTFGGHSPGGGSALKGSRRLKNNLAAADRAAAAIQSRRPH